MYPYCTRWMKEYAASGADDKRAVQDFMEVEAREAAASLRAELNALSQGGQPEMQLDKIFGLGRKKKYGSHQDWAKRMLQFMAEKKD